MERLAETAVRIVRIAAVAVAVAVAAATERSMAFGW